MINVARQGQAKTIAFKAEGKTADVLTSWTTQGVTLTTGLPKSKGGAKKSVASAAKVKIKGKGQKGATFNTIRLTGLKKGKKVKISVTGKQLVLPTSAAVQIVQ